MMQEQRNHPQHRGQVLVLRNHGLFCRHPFVPQRVILVDYSERYLQAQAPAPPLAESLKGEVEPFVRSLEVFSPR
jgi:hypothetical protein